MHRYAAGFGGSVALILKRSDRLTFARRGPTLDPYNQDYPIWLSGVGRRLECRPYADELASGDKDKKTLGSACSVEVIAYLPTIKFYLLEIRIDVRFPVYNR